MMKRKLLIEISTLLLTVFSWGESNNEGLLHANAVIIGSPMNIKDVSISAVNSKPDYIIFGRFCGECDGECATMYKLDVLNNTLVIDHTDSYWEHKNGTPMKFETTIQGKSATLLARQVLDSIPNFIMDSTETTQRFGCPDCTDGCGMFLEVKKDNIVRQFYIDYQTGKLTGEIKIFADHLKKIISQM